MESGTKLGHYTISALIGKGGTGEVYQAKDEKLGRQVAIKVLPEEFARDADRVSRFRREAQLLASLNHPNIAAIYGLEETNERHFLVLELVEGPTLANRIQQGAIPVEEALKLALQIAEALEAAHEKGVIHRDLKPANIKVTEDGNVKVLDFGLAEAFATEETEFNVSNSPTLSMAATQQGLILGTAAYMSPEQAKGRPVDERTDVWAFGCVLYEMLTGRTVFQGEDAADILGAVLAKDVNWDPLPSNLHPRIRELLERCLARQTRDRYGRINDARVDVEKVLSDPDGVVNQSVARATHPTTQSKLAWILVAGFAALGGGLGTWMTLSQPVPAPTTRVTIFHPGTDLLGSSFDGDVAISPDGRTIAYMAAGTINAGPLYLRRLDEDAPLLAVAEDARTPFFSPDGDWLGFVDNVARSFMRVAVTGGPPVEIAPLPEGLAPRGASWGSDGSLIFSLSPDNTNVVTPGQALGLWRISADGGEPEMITAPNVDEGEGLHLFPEILPGGQAVVFTILGFDGSPEQGRIAVLNLRTGTYQVLFAGGTQARYAASGHIVYAASGTLRAVPFDLDRLEVSGRAVPVIDGVLAKQTAAASFAISPDGTLAYLSGMPGSTTERTLLWVDRDGREETVGIEPSQYVYPRISPDGTRVALDDPNEADDIWIWDFQLQTRTRLLIGENGAEYPLWTADSSRVAFEPRTGDIQWKAASNVGTVETLATAVGEEAGRSPSPYFFTPDGTELVFRDQDNPDTNDDIVLIALDNNAVPVPLLNGPYIERNAELSPNGQWMAYQSDESGQFEIYVRPFPDVEGGRVQVSNAGGRDPLWSPDGQELLYLEPGNPVPRMMSIGVDPDGPALSIAGRTPLLDWPYSLQGEGRNYDVSPDGQRFLAVQVGNRVNEEESAAPQLHVVLNWTQELLERVPVD